MDSKVVSVFRERMLLDVVDETWMQDCLSDDEIEIPLGMDLNAEESGGPLMGPVLPGFRTERTERWNDLGLDLFGREP